MKVTIHTTRTFSPEALINASCWMHDYCDASFCRTPDDCFYEDPLVGPVVILVAEDGWWLHETTRPKMTWFEPNQGVSIERSQHDFYEACRNAGVELSL